MNAAQRQLCHLLMIIVLLLLPFFVCLVLFSCRSEMSLAIQRCVPSPHLSLLTPTPLFPRSPDVSVPSPKHSCCLPHRVDHLSLSRVIPCCGCSVCAVLAPRDVPYTSATLAIGNNHENAAVGQLVSLLRLLPLCSFTLFKKKGIGDFFLPLSRPHSVISVSPELDLVHIQCACIGKLRRSRCVRPAEDAGDVECGVA